MPVKGINLPQKINNAFMRHGITSLDEILQMSDSEILAMNNVGKTGLAILKGEFQKLGCMNVVRCKCCGQIITAAQLRRAADAPSASSDEN